MHFLAPCERFCADEVDVGLCVVVARVNMTYLLWFELILCELNIKKRERLCLQEKVKPWNQLVWCVFFLFCPPSPFLWFSIWLRSPELCSVPFSFFNKRILELFLTAALFYFSQEHKNYVQNKTIFNSVFLFIYWFVYRDFVLHCTFSPFLVRD